MAAEEQIQLPTFDLGIESSVEYGNLSMAESFLDESTTPKGEIKKVETPKKEEKKEEPKDDKKNTFDPEKGIKSFLGTEDDEEEDSTEDVDDSQLEPRKKTLKDVVTEDDEEEDDSNLNNYEIITRDLFKDGVLTAEEGEEPITAKTPEELRDLFRKEGQIQGVNWLQGFLERFDENNRELFEAIFVNGVPAKEYLPTFSEVVDFQDLDLEVESNQEKVVREYYKKSKWSDAAVEKKIESLKNTAALEDEAKIVHPILVDDAKDKLKAKSEAEALKQKNLIAEDTQYKESISKILNEKMKDKNIDGIPLTEKDAKKAFDFLYSKKWKAASGELLTDFDVFILNTKKPENHDIRIKIALLAENKFNLSKVAKVAVSKESKELFQDLTIKKTKNKTAVAKSSGW